MTRYTGKCNRGHKFAVDLVDAAEINDPAVRFCACGAARVKVNRVVGRLSETKCSARCTQAIGGDCECECSGENHGSENLIAFR